MRLIPALLLLLLSLPLLAQQAPPPIPPNTVRLSDNLFIDKTEVANIHWLEFLHYIRQDSGEAYYQQMLPDTLVWAQRNLANPKISSAELTKEYLRSPQYRYHPVVGISYAQAQAYARWRSAVVSQKLNSAESLQQLGLAGKRIRIEYRLPSEEEWMQAAAGTLSVEQHPYGYKEWVEKASKRIEAREAWEQLALPKPSFKNFKRSLRKTELPLFQVVASLPEGISLAPEFPQAISTGPQNSLGLQHTIGNVAEMLLGHGQAKGGSFMHTLEDSQITKTQSYFGPAPWLGVRYVANVWVE